MTSHRNAWILHLALQLITALILGLAVVLPLPKAASADPGDLDLTFDNDGKVMTLLGQRLDWALAAVVQPDGKIIAAGDSQTPSYWWPFGLVPVLARYNTDGSLDSGFGGDGKVTADFGHDSAAFEALALQADGKVVAAGWVETLLGSRHIALARFNPDGSPDTTFGDDGIVTTDFSGARDSGSALAIQADGRIVVAGSSAAGASRLSGDLAIVRFHPDGSLDTGFGEDGRVTVDLGGDAGYGSDIAIQADGRIVLSGVDGDDLTLVRLLHDGSLDVSFADEGVFTADLGFSGNALQIQPDAKIVVVGSGYTSYTGSILGLARFSADGSLDGAFGDQGVVITDFMPGDNYHNDFGYDLVIQADGRIVTAGSSETASSLDFALARYHPDGSLDSSFGVGGLFTTDFAGRNDFGQAVALHPDGRIVVVGYTVAAALTLNVDFALARYNVDGSPDAGFGVAGRVTSNFELGHSTPYDVAMQPDDKIIVAGKTYNGSETGWDFALVRYRPDGSVDPGFGRNGVVTMDFSRGDDSIAGLVIQPDGKIVAAGSARIGDDYRFALVRYLRDGALDPAFGSGGVTTAFSGGSASGSAVAIQPDGKIVVAGNASGFALARYNPNGSLDSGFGSSGTVTITLGSDPFGRASDIALQPDGKIVLAGTDRLDFALARFNPDGSLDPTFGDGGTRITDIGGNDRCNGLAILADGKLVAAGDAENSGGFALARYDPDGSLDPAFGTGGIVTTNLGSGALSSDAAIQPGGKILVSGYLAPPLGIGGGDFALVRYQPDGALDQAFGSSGIVITDFAGGTDVGMAIGLQTNGKIVVAGYTMDTFALARYEGWDVLTTYLPVIMQGE